MAPPFREAHVSIMFGSGFNTEAEILDSGVELGFVEKSGAWYSFKGGERIGQGKDKSCEFLKDNPELSAKLEGQIRAAMKDRKLAKAA